MRKTVLAIIFVVLVLISSCNSELRVRTIAFEEETLDFFVGESLSLSPFTIYADTNRGRISISPDAVEFEERTFTKDDVGKDITLRFDYLGFTFSATANVYETIDSITVEETGKAKKYYQGATERGAYNNTFDKDAYTVTAHYKNGQKRALTSDSYTASLFDDTKIGESKLKIKTLIGGDIETDYSVQVVEDPIVSNTLSFLYPPIEYSVYDDNDKNNWVITGSLIYESGYTVSDFKNDRITAVSGDFYFQDGDVKRYKEGENTIEITYNEAWDNLVKFDVNYTSKLDYVVSFDAKQNDAITLHGGTKLEIGTHILVDNIVYASGYNYPSDKTPNISYSCSPDTTRIEPSTIYDWTEDITVTATLGTVKCDQEVTVYVRRF